MQATLSIIRYPKWSAVFGLFSMLLFRLPLTLNKGISFYRLLGSSRNGIFQMKPDYRQWGIFTVYRVNEKNHGGGLTDLNHEKIITRLYGGFINRWFRLFKCEVWTILLEPISGHGSWDGKKLFTGNEREPGITAPVAILTRATIRFKKLKVFWKSTAPMGNEVMTAGGLVAAFGMGEFPFLRQVTFSIWNDMESMESFAYHNNTHKAAMIKARQDGWFGEELFYRFRIKGSAGSMSGWESLGGLQ